MDSLDYTPKQALTDALELNEEQDFDGALVLLISGVNDNDVDLVHFVSGVGSTQLVSYLELVKTKFALRTLGADI